MDEKEKGSIHFAAAMWHFRGDLFGLYPEVYAIYQRRGNDEFCRTQAERAKDKIDEMIQYVDTILEFLLNPEWIQEINCLLDERLGKEGYAPKEVRATIAQFVRDKKGRSDTS